VDGGWWMVDGMGDGEWWMGNGEWERSFSLLSSL